jgi:hypothetical protein
VLMFGDSEHLAKFLRGSNAKQVDTAGKPGSQWSLSMQNLNRRPLCKREITQEF